ncbi:sphingosine kinase 1-like [Gouania willdenowi]|uniref:sphingosine kinase n=1 Tax=Gouania willdenowi TaxID=441366 RepID=A0A8C5H1P0_GOUWI|nr:sphingosine kinase 1 [Gouania willdenowi]
MAENQGLSTVPLFGEFTLSTNRKVRCSVKLTEQEFIVKRLTPAPVGWSRRVHSLKDCLGCRAYRGNDTGDSAAYLSVYFYPLRGRWMRTGISRQRVEHCFRFAALQEWRANLEEAERWARAVREWSSRQRHHGDGVLMQELPRPCRMMVLVNPLSGKGQSYTLYNNHIQRMLNEAGIIHTLFVTERQNHAREMVRDTDLSQWDALVIMSGDGLLYEVINGLLERPDWESAIRTPLGILPGGSGNALAASTHYYTGASSVSNVELLVSCGFLLCRGPVSRMDLVSIHLSSSTRLFSFLSLAWGFVADVDIESEKYRHLGAARFTVGTLVRLASLRIYKGKLSYLPVSREQKNKDSWSQRGEPYRNPMVSTESINVQQLGNIPSQNSRSLHGPPDSLLVPLDQQPPAHWVEVPEKDFVLVLAMYQSHLAEDLLAAPDATLDDGVIHLFYVRAGISRFALLRLFLAMEKGAHLATNCQHLVYTKVRALRLEPLSPQGILTVDGEVVKYGPVQAEVHRGLSRLISG